MLIWILAPIAIGLTCFAIAVMLSFILPLEVTGHYYLNRRLKRYNRVIPPELAVILVGRAIKSQGGFSSSLASKSKIELRADFTRALDLEAFAINCWLENPKDPMFLNDPVKTQLFAQYLPNQAA